MLKDFMDKGGFESLTKHGLYAIFLIQSAIIITAFVFIAAKIRILKHNDNPPLKIKEYLWKILASLFQVFCVLIRT